MFQTTLPTTQPVSSANASRGVVVVNNNSGVTDLSKGLVIDLYTIPSSFTYQVTSTDAGAAVTIYAFNNSVLNAAVTTNGGGANTIVNTYGDGFSGRVYNEYLKSANGGRGILIQGFTIIATNFTTGDETPTIFPTLNMQIISANGQGGVIPIPIDLSEAVRNTQYKSGILTVVKPFYFNSLTQISLLMPKNTALAFTFFTEAANFNG